MTKIDMILAYLYNKSLISDSELEQLRHNLRNRNIDQEDALEYIIAQTKADTVNEVLLNVMRIIGDLR